MKLICSKRGFRRFLNMSQSKYDYSMLGQPSVHYMVARWSRFFRQDVFLFVGVPFSLLTFYGNLPFCVLFSVFLIIFGLCFALQLLEDRLLYITKEPLSVKYLCSNPLQFGYSKWTHVKLQATGNGQPLITGFFLLRSDESERVTCPSILFLHGNAGNISSRLYVCRFMSDKLNCNIMLFDYRGYGKSEGRPTEEGLYNDCERALNFLCARTDIDLNKIFVFGRSLGGALAIYLATNPNTSSKIRGVIVENSFTSLPDMASHMFRLPFLLPEWLFMNIYPSCRRLTSCKRDIEDIGKIPPMLFLSGQADTLIPSWMMGKLADAYNITMNKKSGDLVDTTEIDSFLLHGTDGLVKFPNGHHNDTWSCDQWPDVINRFINQLTTCPQVTNFTV